MSIPTESTLSSPSLGDGDRCDGKRSTANERVVLEATGDAHRLEGVRQLILRGRKLTGFDPACVSRLQNLAVLSLSNNSIRDLREFRHMASLVELNLNFNAVASLEGLACPQLRRLYLSNNLMASTERMPSFPMLRTLCLFKNIIPDISTALQPLRGLSNLKELDLDGNPCARSRGYKHRAVRACPGLIQLDGDDILQLDHDLSALFFEEQQINMTRRAAENGGDFGYKAEGGRQRPATASPVSKGTNGAHRRNSTGKAHPGVEAKIHGKVVCRKDRGVKAHGAVEAPEEEARLLSSDRLNNDPHLLGYLAEEVLADPSHSPRDVINTFMKEENCENSPHSSADRKDRIHRKNANCSKARGLRSHNEARNVRVETGPSPSLSLSHCTTASDKPSTLLVNHQEEDKAQTIDGDRNNDNTEFSRPLIQWLDHDINGPPLSSQFETTSDIDNSAGAPRDGSMLMDCLPHGEEVMGSGGAIARIHGMDEADHPPPPPAASPQAGSVALDRSNPYTTIRKLLKLVENLQLERAELELVRTNREIRMPTRETLPCCSEEVCHDSGMATISTEDLRRLRLENRNMHLLLAENRELKNDARVAGVNADKAKEMRREVDKLREKLREAGEELEVVRAQLRDATIVSGSGSMGNDIVCSPADDSVASPISFGCGTSTSNTPASMASSRRANSASVGNGSGNISAAADVLADCESVDEELTELFRRNEQTMGEIRRDLALARLDDDQIEGPGLRTSTNEETVSIGNQGTFLPMLKAPERLQKRTNPLGFDSWAPSCEPPSVYELLSLFRINSDADDNGSGVDSVVRENDRVSSISDQSTTIDSLSGARCCFCSGARSKRGSTFGHNAMKGTGNFEGCNTREDRGRCTVGSEGGHVMVVKENARELLTSDKDGRKPVL